VVKESDQLALLGVGIIVLGVVLVVRRDRLANRSRPPLMPPLAKSKWWPVPVAAGIAIIGGYLAMALRVETPPAALGFVVPGALLIQYGIAKRTGRAVLPPDQGRPRVTAGVGIALALLGVVFVVAGLSSRG
jgi:drug/metabolite transporter (DMT)-like permease